MAITPADRLAIAETIEQHGHLFDLGELDRLSEIFTDDVVYDLTGLGTPRPLVGIDAVVQAAVELGDANPVGHHVTNVVLTEVGADGDEVRCRSKSLAVLADGTAASGTYVDTLVRTAAGWRIRHRVVTAQRTPLSGAHRPR